MPQKTLASAVTDFVEAVGLLIRRVRAANRAQDLSWSGAIVIKHLATNGPATTADLARATAMKPQSMGAIIASLEELGLVARKPHPTDRRQMTIKLTAKGAAARKRARDAKRAWLIEAIGRLDARDQDTLFAAGKILKRLADSSPAGE